MSFNKLSQRHIRSPLIVLMLCLFMLAPGLQQESRGCGCAGYTGFAEATSVFTGKVVGIRHVVSPTRYYEIVFRVTAWEKGAGGRRAVVRVSCLNVACCGFEFKRRSRYSVYTYDEHGELYTGNCTGTHEIKNSPRRELH